MRHGKAAAALVLAVGVAASGCTAEQRQNLFGGVAAEGLRVAVEDAFASAGFPIEGELDCSVEESGNAEISADCSGTTQDGADVAFTGSYDAGDIDFTNGVQGSFTGRVDDAVVFETDCLGCSSSGN